MSELAVRKLNTEANPWHYALTGALAGYATKHVIPVTKKEQDLYKLDHFEKQASKQAEKQILQNFTNAIKKDATNAEKPDQASKIFCDTFTKTKKTGDVLKSEAFKKANEETQKGVKAIVEHYNLLKTAAKEISKDYCDMVVKNMGRNSTTYATVGFLGGLAFALGKNALDKNGERIAAEQKIIDKQNGEYAQEKID